MSDGYSEETRKILSALDSLAREVGGSPVSDRGYQVHRATLQKLVGEDPDDLMTELLHADFIDAGLDDVNNEVFLFSFTPRGIECLKQQTQQIREEKIAAQKRQMEQATVDAKLLIQRFRPKKPDETVKVTLEKLRELLGESTESPLEDRLDRLYATKFCAANVSGEGEYELTFFTKSVELTADQEKPPRKVSTETTIDVDGVRKHIELRSLVGSLLGGPVDVVARACQSWLVDLETEEKDHVKRQVHIYLERFEARWGKELDTYDPSLYLRVCMALGKPERASLNPILALEDMEVA